jgi:pyridoxamine 5'-phosphate oxidase
MDLSDLRISYTKAGLLESDLSRDPFEQFSLWFEQARAAGVLEPNAMSLATADADGAPNCRIVLLKAFDARGFVFYTNAESRKGEELQANPRAALLFYWPELERQIRISGGVHPVSREEAEAYFATRPPGHQLGAWASRQSSVVSSRDTLHVEMQAAEERFGESPAPLPPWWGGYRVRAERMEFWQGRLDRLHDRLQYVLQPDGTWIVERLSP